jgi:hypothetical protein
VGLVDWFGRKVSNPHLKDQDLASCHWTTPERWKGQWVPPPLLVDGSHACIYQHLDPVIQHPQDSVPSVAAEALARVLLRWRHRLDFHQRLPGCNRAPTCSATVPRLRKRASNPRRRWLTTTRSAAELLRTGQRAASNASGCRHGVLTPGFRVENPADSPLSDGGVVTQVGLDPTTSEVKTRRASIAPLRQSGR